MQEILSQHDKISGYFPKLTKPAVENFLIVTCCIILSRTVNLYKSRGYVSLVLNEERDRKSSYKLLIRFFHMQEVTSFLCGVSLLIIKLLGSDFVELIVDRTCEEIGEKKVNLLTFGIVISGVFVPLCWQDLDYKGNSGFEHRHFLLERMIQLLKQAGIDIKGKVLLADREFIGHQWFEYLQSKGIDFVIRVKAKSYYEIASVQGKKRVCLKKFNPIVDKNGIFGVALTLKGHPYYFVICKNLHPHHDERYIYLITTLKDAKKVALLYRKRWKIEHSFKHLKTNGYNLQDLNLKIDNKVDIMMAVLTVAYIFAVKKGIILQSKTPSGVIKMKNYANGSTERAESVFRIGADEIKFIAANLKRVLDFLVTLMTDNQALIKSG